MATITSSNPNGAFSHPLSFTRPTPNAQPHRGEQYDSDLSLYYLRARYYNPASVSFMSREPEDGKSIDPDTFQKYLYGDGNPANRTDPRGKEALVEYMDLKKETKLETFLIDNTICGILGLAVSELTKPFDEFGGAGAGFLCSALQAF